jgi:Region found in RelA / SpoT proteins
MPNGSAAGFPHRRNLEAGWAVADFPRFEYSMKDVKRAGEVIASGLIWTDETAPKIMEAFQIANNWREAHAFPMRSVRWQLVWYMRYLGLDGVTAARLKRMQAIRRKLGRIGLHLNQLQDLGGCRAVLQRIDDVRALTNILRERGRHELRDEDDYISRPKRDGYRSQHMMLNYRGRGAGKIYDDRRIEVQIRTRLQHSWATAVEAVGLLRGEDLKGNQGSPEWLRLFTLMSAEFAVLEGCPMPPGAPESEYHRLAERLGRPALTNKKSTPRGFSEHKSMNSAEDRAKARERKEIAFP